MGESMNYDVTATIVTYNNDTNVLSKGIESFLDTTLNVHLYVVDNSPTKIIAKLCGDARITYLHTAQNLGFGKGHNIILADVYKLGEFHLILNPDIIIEEGTLEVLVDYLKNNKEVGVVMPKILNPDKTVQLLPKLYPHPLNLILRFLQLNTKSIQDIDRKYMMADMDSVKPYNVGIVSGCFMLIRSKLLEDERFDERFFMYFEDFDLSRRLSRKTLLQLHPQVSVYHHYERGSHNSLFLFKTMVFSMIKYFNKYGWIIDKERKVKNSELYNK